MVINILADSTQALFNVNEHLSSPVSTYHNIYKKIFNIPVFLQHIKTILELNTNARKRVKINPHLCKHRIIKNFARALLHCRRDFNINYVDITEYVYFFIVSLFLFRLL